MRRIRGRRSRREPLGPRATMEEHSIHFESLVPSDIKMVNRMRAFDWS
jgi:hypothetical protein